MEIYLCQANYQQIRQQYNEQTRKLCCSIHSPLLDI